MLGAKLSIYANWMCDAERILEHAIFTPFVCKTHKTELRKMHNWMTWQTTTTARIEDVSSKTFLSNSLHASQAIRRAILYPQAFYFVRLTAFRVIKNSPLIRQPSAILVIFVWIQEQWTQMAHLLHMRKWSKEKFRIPNDPVAFIATKCKLPWPKCPGAVKAQ